METDVQSTERIAGALDCCLTVGSPTKIDRTATYGATNYRSQLITDCLDALEALIDEEDVRASGREGPGTGSTESACTRDEHSTASQSELIYGVNHELSIPHFG